MSRPNNASPTSRAPWWRRWLRARPRIPIRRADHVLHWGTDGITLDDFNLHVVLIGRSGSGKTSSGYWPILDGALSLGLSSHTTTTKIDDAVEAVSIGRRLGVRTIVSGPGSHTRMDVMAAITRYAADVPLAVTDFISGLARMVSPKGGGNDEGQVWENLAREKIHHACVLVHAAHRTVTLKLLNDFVSGAATSEAVLVSEAFQKGFHWRTLKLADQAKAASATAIDIDNALDFYTGRWVRLNDRTRSSIEANAGLALGYLMRGVLRERLASDSPNVWPEMLDDEPTLFVSNWPTASMGDTGRLAQAAERYALQVYTLNRKVTPNTRMWAMMSDEFSAHVNENDVRYLSVCRSQKIACVMAVQNRELLDVAFSGDMAAKAKTDALLSNYGTTLVYASIGESAAWASRRIGHKLQFTYSATSNRNYGVVPDLWSPPASQSTASVSQQMLEIYPAHAFSTLRQGGPCHGYVCDCVIIACRPLAPHGRTYQTVALPQYRSSDAKAAT